MYLTVHLRFRKYDRQYSIIFVTHICTPPKCSLNDVSRVWHPYTFFKFNSNTVPQFQNLFQKLWISLTQCTVVSFHFAMQRSSVDLKSKQQFKNIFNSIVDFIENDIFSFISAALQLMGTRSVTGCIFHNLSFFYILFAFCIYIFHSNTHDFVEDEQIQIKYFLRDEVVFSYLQ